MNEENYESYFTVTNDGLDIEANNIDTNCITSKNNKFSMDEEGNLVCNSITTVQQNNSLNIDMIYPIGSIYMSVSAVNPSTLFGGTWEQIKGRFLVGTGAVENNTTNYWGETSANEYDFPLGEMSGATGHGHLLENAYANINYQWVGNENRLVGDFQPHWFRGNRYTTSQGMAYADGQWDCSYAATVEGGISRTLHLPPYLAISIWKRVS